MNPWLDKKEWTHNKIYSSSKFTMLFLWFFTIIWNGISFPAVFSNLHLINDIQNKPETAIIFVFPVIGLLVTFIAIKETLNWKRFGKTPLVLDPFPGSIGGHVGGTIEVAIPYTPSLEADVALTCIFTYMSGSGKDRSRKEKVIWQNESLCFVEPGQRGTRLTFRFDVPSEMPESDAKRGSKYHYWQVRISAKIDGPDFVRRYDIPVYKTNQQSQNLTQASEDHHLNLSHAESGIESISNIKNIPGGIEAHFPAFQRPGASIAGAIFGIVFAGAGFVAGNAGAPLVFPIVFGAFGGVIFLASLYTLFKSMTISIQNDTVTFSRFLLNIKIKQITLNTSEIQPLEIKSHGSTSTTNKHTIYYKLVSKTPKGKSIVFGERLNKRAEAEKLKEFFELYLN